MSEYLSVRASVREPRQYSSMLIAAVNRALQGKSHRTKTRKMGRRLNSTQGRNSNAGNSNSNWDTSDIEDSRPTPVRASVCDVVCSVCLFLRLCLCLLMVFKAKSATLVTSRR